MKLRGWMFFNVLINRYHKTPRDTLLRLLPQEEMQMAIQQDISSSQLEPLLNHGQQVLERLHYSWLKPFLEALPHSLQPFFVAALPLKLGNTLKHYMGQNLQVPSLSEALKPFFLQTLYNKLEGDQHLPIEYLPETAVTPLIQWSKESLVELIDFLGLHDLATDIRQIVAKQALKNIYDCLPAKQLNYLKICMHQKEQVVGPSLNLNHAKLDGQQMRKDLHRRGLMRLGKALSGQHKDFIWYIARTLDIGRGTLLSQYVSPQPLPKVTPALTIQVTNLMNFLKKESKNRQNLNL